MSSQTLSTLLYTARNMERIHDVRATDTTLKHFQMLQKLGSINFIAENAEAAETFVAYVQAFLSLFAPNTSSSKTLVEQPSRIWPMITVHIQNDIEVSANVDAEARILVNSVNFEAVVSNLYNSQAFDIFKHHVCRAIDAHIQTPDGESYNTEISFHSDLVPWNQFLIFTSLNKDILLTTALSDKNRLTVALKINPDKYA